MKKLGKERRSVVVYARVKPSNKAYIGKHAKNLSKSGTKHSEAMALDSIIEAHKGQTANLKNAGKTINT